MPPFNRLLVANRGEIAVRILRTAHRLGYETVAVFSDADAAAPHVSMATWAVRLGPAEVSHSYLSLPRIIEAMEKSGADALHPGYGFLSENPALAAACEERGWVFVGPSARVIDIMGDKANAKAVAEGANVPVVPGYRGLDQNPSRLIAEGERIGFPLLVKAAAGGGGRGMRRVTCAAELPDAIASARAEAAAAFGRDALLLERVIEDAFHVEVQIAGDAHGNLLHLGERECSVQRRHQKVIEEAPSPHVDDALRARMGEAAVAVAKAIDYQNVGTVEFLLEVDPANEGSFYFLEMNTRLQVEHPVTELVYGVDLVEWQLRIAAGERLPRRQTDLQPRGHAMEARLYAEDPGQGFMPQTGELLSFSAPPELRVDAGVHVGQVISPHYDPMVAKVIAWGDDREHARRRLRRGLAQTVLAGFNHNIPFLGRVLGHDAFVQGAVTTGWLDTHGAALAAGPKPQAIDWAAAALLWLSRGGEGGWRIAHPAERVLPLVLEGDRRDLHVLQSPQGWHITHGEHTVLARVVERREGGARVEVDGACFFAATVAQRDGDEDVLWVHTPTWQGAVRTVVPARGVTSAAGDGLVRAPTSGTILEVRVAPGDSVHAGEIVVSLEAMKMEHPLRADISGIVREVHVQPRGQAKKGMVVVVITP